MYYACVKMEKEGHYSGGVEDNFDGGQSRPKAVALKEKIYELLFEYIPPPECATGPRFG